MSEQTHFGFRQVPTPEKKQLVAEVFRSVADKYDVMNDLMSLGLHRYWKRYAVDHSAVKRGDTVLDLAGGTGDMSALFAKRVGSQGKVILCDINEAMLEQGRAKLIDKGLVGNIGFSLADAEQLPFTDNQFDIVNIAFGLRNVTDKAAALAQLFRVLKPGGKAIILEFSTPTHPTLGALYDKYSFACIPKLGKYIANDEASYQYLVESIRKHPDQETLKRLMEDAQFQDCGFTNLTGGIVALHHGYKY